MTWWVSSGHWQHLGAPLRVLCTATTSKKSQQERNLPVPNLIYVWFKSWDWEAHCPFLYHSYFFLRSWSNKDIRDEKVTSRLCGCNVSAFAKKITGVAICSCSDDVHSTLRNRPNLVWRFDSIDGSDVHHCLRQDGASRCKKVPRLNNHMSVIIFVCQIVVQKTKTCFKDK